MHHADHHHYLGDGGMFVFCFPRMKIRGREKVNFPVVWVRVLGWLVGYLYISFNFCFQDLGVLGALYAVVLYLWDLVFHLSYLLVYVYMCLDGGYGGNSLVPHTTCLRR